jgi:hypothetical protein
MIMTKTTITVVAAAVVESNSDRGGSDGNSNGWGGGVGSEGNSDGSGDDSDNGNNGDSCDSDGDNDGDDAGNDEEDGHDDDDTTVAAVRAAGATKDNYGDSNGRGHKQQSTNGPTLSCARWQQG